MDVRWLINTTVKTSLSAQTTVSQVSTSMTAASPVPIW